jgi:hypothetical protein
MICRAMRLKICDDEIDHDGSGCLSYFSRYTAIGMVRCDEMRLGWLDLASVADVNGNSVSWRAY